MFILHYLLLFAIRRQYTIDKATARLVTTPHDTIIVTTASDDDNCPPPQENTHLSYKSSLIQHYSLLGSSRCLDSHFLVLSAECCSYSQK